MVLEAGLEFMNEYGYHGEDSVGAAQVLTPSAFRASIQYIEWLTGVSGPSHRKFGQLWS